MVDCFFNIVFIVVLALIRFLYYGYISLFVFMFLVTWFC